MVFLPLLMQPKRVPFLLPSLCELILTTWQPCPRVFSQMSLKTAFAQKPARESSRQSCA